ncbi:MAG: hypothetical protein AAF221_07865 [Pseudomonadota bacterium]
MSAYKANPKIRVSYSYKHAETLPEVKSPIYETSPNMRFQFDLNRDPYVRLQILDRGKSEAERREEASGRGSAMVEQDQSAPSFRPPSELRRGVDKQDFNQRWMAELRAAVLNAANQSQSQESCERDRAPVSQEPSR